ncbi:MAG TPA: formate dehydrogenase [Methylibium sp.]|nr:formate dehydrogenase [Methylibium sp.]
MKEPQSKLSRRHVFAGAGTVGALAAAAAVLPVAQDGAPGVDDKRVAEAEPNGGYRLSEHVQRYYRTAKV